MGSSSEMDKLKKLIAGNHAEARAWCQEDTAAATTLAATVDSLATKVQDLTACIANLELSDPPPPPHRRFRIGTLMAIPLRRRFPT
jgi:hypothetical protein